MSNNQAFHLMASMLIDIEIIKSALAVVRCVDRIVFILLPAARPQHMQRLFGEPLHNIESGTYFLAIVLVGTIR